MMSFRGEFRCQRWKGFPIQNFKGLSGFTERQMFTKQYFLSNVSVCVLWLFKLNCFLVLEAVQQLI